MASNKTMVLLKSSDDEEFQVDATVAIESQTIKNMVEDDCADSAIPVANVTSSTLTKVIEYCKKHVEAREAAAAAGGGGGDEKKEDDMGKWDLEFMKVDTDTLYDLMMAANYLNIKGLLDLTCQTVAEMIKGKTPEEIRNIFNIKNDFTPEEEEAIRKEHGWAFQ